MSGEKANAKQTLFAAADDGITEIEEVARENAAVLRDADVAVLLHDEPDVSIRRILERGNRSDQTGNLDPRVTARQLLEDATSASVRTRTGRPAPHPGMLIP